MSATLSEPIDRTNPSSPALRGEGEGAKIALAASLFKTNKEALKGSPLAAVNSHSKGTGCAALRHKRSPGWATGHRHGLEVLGWC